MGSTERAGPPKGALRERENGVNVNIKPEPSPELISARHTQSKMRRLAFMKGGAKCVFLNCETRTWEDADASFLEVAHINALRPAGVRYDPEIGQSSLRETGNYIVVCPNHHRIIDRNPEFYTADFLRELRDTRAAEVEEEVRRAVESGEYSTPAASPLAIALDAWDRLEHEDSEEFWQNLFSRIPSCLLPLLGGRAYELRGKCYVGGKGFDNKGGNVLDFLAVHPGNVACIEIKTPGTPLMAKRKQYRNNVYFPHDELVGAHIQVLESRRKLTENLFSLNNEAEYERRVSAPSPTCYIVIGNLEKEKLEPGERTSFELYRSSLRDVSIVTFDELFGGLKALVESMLETSA